MSPAASPTVAVDRPSPRRDGGPDRGKQCEPHQQRAEAAVDEVERVEPPEQEDLDHDPADEGDASFRVRISTCPSVPLYRWRQLGKQ